MRKITQEAVNAFIYQENFKKDNTEVEYIGGGKSKMFLYGNLIAEIIQTGDIEETRISNAGWFSNTTKERLNGIPGVSIQQKKGEWFLNGVKWDGEWIAI